jgi:hypothetical protein
MKSGIESSSNHQEAIRIFGKELGGKNPMRISPPKSRELPSWKFPQSTYTPDYSDPQAIIPAKVAAVSDGSFNVRARFTANVHRERHAAPSGRSDG